MIVGFDVCHDTQRKNISYGAMVATMNDSHTNYFSCVEPHENGEELSSHLNSGISSEHDCFVNNMSARITSPVSAAAPVENRSYFRARGASVSRCPRVVFDVTPARSHGVTRLRIGASKARTFFFVFFKKRRLGIDLDTFLLSNCTRHYSIRIVYDTD